MLDKFNLLKLQEILIKQQGNLEKIIKIKEFFNKLENELLFILIILSLVFLYLYFKK